MARPLKVLYLLHDARRSGVPAVAANFIRLAAGVNVEPTVLFAYDGIYADELRAEGVPVLTLGPRTPLWWRAKRFLLNRYLLTHGTTFDVVHIHSLKLAWSVLIAKALGLKVVFHLHELPRRGDWLLQRAIAAADAVVYCSETCAAHYAGYPARLSRTIVNAMHLPPAALHREPAGRLKVVMAASLNKNKGQDLLLRAFAKLACRDAELWLYGTTGLSARRYVRELQVFAEQHQLGERVFFPGPSTEVFRVFAEASVVVHTSWTESFGMALVEAQSCAVPVIAHDLEGMREVVLDGVTGYLVQPGAVEELAARLDELLGDAALRSKMGEAGRAMVERRFDMTSRVAEYRQLYDEVLNR
ncbi:glucosyltransferase [Geomonas limicola]|uniref:Glucosyltransferase n=1 Tax=Geomonas limicola TaxID=2740186 RepID=A0A6V8NC87_9BACT|nr:glycosyltransferase family 4 protein [Geomonas limicola]GFO70146.1 glucosyltransferase [Geomonas limicola]